MYTGNRKGSKYSVEQLWFLNQHDVLSHIQLEHLSILAVIDLYTFPEQT